MGVRLGTGIEETSIGTTMGVIKCRTVNRLQGNDRWNRRLVLDMQGIPWEPVPGKPGQHIPVEIGQDGQTMDDAEESMLPKKDDVDEGEQEMEYQHKTHSLHISRTAINKYGTTEGCPARMAISKRGHIPGRIGYNHSTACRERVKAAMQDDLEYRRLLHKHEVHQEAGNVEMPTEAQINEKRHNVQKAANAIERDLKGIARNVEKRFTQIVFNHLFAKMEVAEIDSPSRVINMARRVGLRAGWALDITTQDDDGRGWDFNQPEMRNRAIRKVLQDKQLLPIGSPMCIACSQLNNINHCRMEPTEVQRRMEYGRRHLEFCTRLYNIQWEAGRYLLHEHPASAS